MGVLKAWNGTGWENVAVSSGYGLPDGTVDNAPLVWDTTTSTWIQGPVPPVNARLTKLGLAVAAGEWHFAAYLSNGYDSSPASFKFAAKYPSGGDGDETHIIEGVAAGNVEDYTGYCVVTTNASMGTKIFSEVCSAFHGNGPSLYIKFAVAVTLDLSYTITNEITGAGIGHTGFPIQGPGGAIYQTVIL